MKNYNGFKTREDRHSFYKSNPWRAMRLYILNRDKLCQVCLSKNKLTIANTVDHIVDLSVSPHLSLDPKNCQGLCTSCHSRKTSKEHNGKTTTFKPKNLMWDINEMLDI